MDDQRPPSLSWGMWKRFLFAGVLIVLLTGGATATVALNTVSGIAHEIITHDNTVSVSKKLVQPEYNGGPETYLILGSDRRAKSQDALDRTDPPHSDTILLVRFDPAQGQTSVLSIPRDLLVNIKSASGAYYPQEKINAAYTYGAKLGGTKGSMVLAAETIEHEVFPGLKLNGIIDVNFAGFIGVVDSLGCVYVNVDHRYLHINGEGGELYSEINLQPGYQKLCYNNALSYVRYRHGDSDFVRVARQQDFLRNLREQVSPENVIGQIHHGRQGGGQGDRHRRPQLLGEPADRTRQADRLLAGQAAAPGQVPRRKHQLRAEGRLLRDVDPGDWSGPRSTTSCTAMKRSPRHRSRTPPAEELARQARAYCERHRRRGAGASSPHRPRRRPNWQKARSTCRSACSTRRFKRPPANCSRRCAPTTCETRSITFTTPTWSSGARTRSAATTTSRAPTG